MIALVPSSASAHATDTDFDGENVRSNPATGTALPGTLLAPATDTPVIGSARPASINSRWASVTIVPASTPLPPSKSASPAPRNTPGGVPEVA